MHSIWTNDKKMIWFDHLIWMCICFLNWRRWQWILLVVSWCPTSRHDRSLISILFGTTDGSKRPSFLEKDEKETEKTDCFFCRFLKVFLETTWRLGDEGRGRQKRLGDPTRVDACGCGSSAREIATGRHSGASKRKHETRTRKEHETKNTKMLRSLATQKRTNFPFYSVPCFFFLLHFHSFF